ncbi:MAG: GAF domain-containing SpoIIE family protein phosphatase [Bacteroidota bacterium]
MRLISKYSLLVLLGISTWIPILVINYYYWLFKDLNYSVVIFPWYLSPLLRSVYFAIFFVGNYFIVGQVVRRIEKWDVIDLLWKLLVIGISGISLIFLFNIIEEYYEGNPLHAPIQALSASVNLYAVLVFALSTLFIYRKLILYQKNKRKVISWYVLQAVLLLGLARLFILPETEMAINGTSGNVDFANIYISVLLPLFFGISLFLSANVNWSAYLNFNQKLKSLFLILIIVLLFVAFLVKFPFDALPNAEDIFTLMRERYVILGLFFLFPVIYTLFSGLVLIFNLPTSSVFEQRSSELATIQRINQSIQANLDSEEILRTLLDASLLTSNATGGWIEVIDEQDGGRAIGIPYLKNITEEEITRLRDRDDLTQEVIARGKHIHIRNLRKQKNFRYAKTRIRSLLALPIMTSKKPIGVIYLINELSGSFEEETIISLVSMTEQSGISIENAELVAQSIDLEIYREQLRVAKTFQKQILPQELPGTERIEFFTLSQEVDEIGGDFYDVVLQDNTYKIAIGDVSGKGTTAAFYMAETKGIFQALTQLDMGVRDFVITANRALSSCLDAKSFMTLTYVHVDMDRQEIELMRAGHCQTLYYCNSTDTLKVMEEGVPGLAIVRSNRFEKMVGEPERMRFSSGDLMVLFTDGIIEAKNIKREEFSFERLQEIVYRLRKTDSRLIAETLVNQVKAFTGGRIEDDYSILVVKFL